MEGGGEICRLPEDCISHVLSLTSPRDSCRSSLVSIPFRSAAGSDAVWEGFLPSDYEEILSRAVDPVSFSSNKELYFRLCDSILIDGGRKSFSLEKESGGKCYTVCARDLFIAGGDEQWWRWVSDPDSRFPEVAELVDICWLEIHGKIDSKVLSPRTTYAVYLIFKADGESRGLNFPAQEAWLTLGSHESRHTVCLRPDEHEMQRRTNIHRLQTWRVAVGAPRLEESVETIIRDARPPQEREDGWMEMEMGEFFNEEGEDGDVEMCLKEVKGGHWKKGLIILGMEVRPKI